ncbi:DUF6221 family protein [Streptomyces sp. NPDC088812]|uniref:DUF6221 family protein n=1 Tax=Streptomyces sp. NPDC088812 TaxID=3365905 RepID=UPI0037F32FE2
MEIVDFLRAQLDEDERIARAATPGPWWVDSTINTESINAGDGTTVIAGSRWGGEAPVFESDEDAAFIAAHDPERVLREIGAERVMINVIAPAQAAALDAEHGCCHEGEAILAGECPNFPPNDLPLLRLLAQMYADRPGYQEAWRQ